MVAPARHRQRERFAHDLLAREQLTGAAPPPSARKMVDAFRPWLEGRVGKQLEHLGRVSNDQEAFGQVVRRMTGRAVRAQ